MTFILAKTLAALSLLTLVQSLCPLCGIASELPKRWTYRVEDGQTCQEVYIGLGDVDEDSNVCRSEQQKNQELCCGDEEPAPFNFPPTSAPMYNGPFGDEPDCPICGTAEYPGIPNGFIVARYVGEFTCDQLYYRGLNGMTPFFMCGPLQDFAEVVCGCGESNPKCEADSTQCWDGNAPTPTSPASAPAPSPQMVEPTVFNRKTPPEGGKVTTRLSGDRGGAAGRLRGVGRQMSENVSLPKGTELPALVDSSTVEEGILQ